LSTLAAVARAALPSGWGCSQMANPGACQRRLRPGSTPSDGSEDGDRGGARTTARARMARSTTRVSSARRWSGGTVFLEIHTGRRHATSWERVSGMVLRVRLGGEDLVATGRRGSERKRKAGCGDCAERRRSYRQVR
jgi:hypothetical protein